MKKLALAVAFSTIVGVVAGCMSGCTTAQDAHSIETNVFTATQIACVLEEATLKNEEIAKACGIANALIPSLSTILAAHREGKGVPAPAGCGPHASNDDHDTLHLTVCSTATSMGYPCSIEKRGL